MRCWSSGEWFRPILALFGFHVYVSHLKCVNKIQSIQMKAIFKTVSSNEIVLWSFVDIDYNHVEFFAHFNTGYLHKFIVFETKLTKLYIDFDILSRGYNYFHENSKCVHFILRVFNFLGQKSNFRDNLWWSSFWWCIHKMTFWEHILLRKLNILHAN